MTDQPSYLKAFPRDFSAGVVVFLVALPLCLGIALASGAPPISGLVAGVAGGLVVGLVSGSHTSVSGPAAGLAAVVVTQIETLGSFEGFLVAVIAAGALQVVLGALKAGSLAAFFPSSVIKGLLSAIGILLILKQIPHLFGHDPDWLGDMSFQQPDGENTFSELVATMFHVHPGATAVGLGSLALLVAWELTKLKKIPVPGPLIVVVFGVGLAYLMRELGDLWGIGETHLVQVPIITGNLSEMRGALPSPDLSAFKEPAFAVAAVTIAIVASLETLLNLEAVDKLDNLKRVSPPNRELIAQGLGNMTSGLMGGLPVTSVIVRSSVNVASGALTKMSAFIHGILLVLLVLYLPQVLNLIPLSCLAAILLVTGFKLASPKVFRSMWKQGRNQFLPFIVTIVAIVVTDLLVGILIGMATAVFFILYGNLKRPLRKISERHVTGEILRIELANQVSFLNRASLREALTSIPNGSKVVLDARNTVYMDSDVGALIREFETEIAPAHDIELNMVGFEDHHELNDRVTYVDVVTREDQDRATPEDVLEFLKAGNERFATGQPIIRDHRLQVGAVSSAQHPLAAVLACMESRSATEMIFDLRMGDIFSIRVAGNIVSDDELGSMEYACAVAGAKLILVLGHTRCVAVTTAIDQLAEGVEVSCAPECEHLASVTGHIGQAVLAETETTSDRTSANEEFVNRVVRANVRRTMAEIRERSKTLRRLVDEGKVLLAGGIYDVDSGKVEVL